MIHRGHRGTPVWPLAALLLAVLTPGVLRGQGLDLANRPVAAIRVEGLVRVSEQLVLNQVRTRPGDPYDPAVVEADIVRITHLGQFATVHAQAEPLDDGSIRLTYILAELPLIADVQVVGNKKLSDQELLGLVLLRAGDPLDPFLIDRGVEQIRRAYEGAGHFVTEVNVDQEVLDESAILIIRIREGPVVRVRGITVEGNTAFTVKQLLSPITTKTYMPILRKGVLSRDELDADVARVRTFYHDRGYLDAQVGRRIDLAPNQKDAVVVFFVDEGREYTVGEVRIEGNEVFSTAQITETITLKTGDVFSAASQRDSREALIDLYGQLGYIEVRVRMERLFHERSPQVTLLVTIDEGPHAYTVGTVAVRGNQLTKGKVIHRQVRGMEPGRRFDRSGIKLTERRLSESSLFSQAKVTLLGDRNDQVRDVLIEVKEANTGSLSFGAGISSDSGLLGAIDLVQRNFDIADVPSSWSDFIHGKPFRGAGQYFALTLQPGDEFSRYSMTFREPHVFDSPYFFDSSFFFFDREREDWEEERAGISLGVGKRFGDVWSAAVRFRVEEIEVSSIEVDAPVDAFAVMGDNTVTSIGVTVSRSTTDSRIFPTEGSEMEFGITRVGAFGGDFDFTKATGEAVTFWTVDEDFFGRPTVVKLRVEAGVIFEDNEAPLFERFYSGGHRSFRGFNLRGVGPRGIRADTGTEGDDPVGGDWMFLVGAEYNFPVYKDVVRGVLFLDTGTVQSRFGLDKYRVSVGGGMRVKVPFLGQAPFALDFAIPVAKQNGDETRVFSFDLALPF